MTERLQRIPARYRSALGALGEVYCCWELIEQLLTAGATKRAVWQALTRDALVTSSYDTFRRAVHRYQQTLSRSPLPLPRSNGSAHRTTSSAALNHAVSLPRDDAATRVFVPNPTPDLDTLV